MRICADQKKRSAQLMTRLLDRTCELFDNITGEVDSRLI